VNTSIVVGSMTGWCSTHFDAAHAVVRATVEHDLPPLVAAVRRLLDTTD
jgi:hypothetical protein